LVQSVFLRPKKVTEIMSQQPLSGNLEFNMIETDDDTGSDWLYQN
jgi:hypothetical protein